MAIQEFVIISDDDGHNYVCPADKEDEANATLEAITAYWNCGDYEIEPPKMPEYLQEVGGAISRVKFTGFRIE